jgi:hypothetical protein
VETIFVGIPSMADTETSATVRNAIESAEFPERVFIGVSFKDLNKKEYKRVLALKEKYPIKKDKTNSESEQKKITFNSDFG